MNPFFETRRLLIHLRVNQTIHIQVCSLIFLPPSFAVTVYSPHICKIPVTVEKPQSGKPAAQLHFYLFI